MGAQPNKNDIPDGKGGWTEAREVKVVAKDNKLVTEPKDKKK